MAKLYFRYGAMNSGKSTALLQAAYNYEERGMTVLLVEQNANMALKLADRAYVMETGAVVMEDDAAALRENADIRKAYLGQ